MHGIIEEIIASIYSMIVFMFGSAKERSLKLIAKFFQSILFSAISTIEIILCTIVCADYCTTRTWSS